ncbi:sorting nexin-11 [Scomber scombrus]|uniref:Sorting nexin-11 n=1 Tax=Scomber scombrus TaxID=13677 RepID=A0AAV1Q104_SCOSC
MISNQEEDEFVAVRVQDPRIQNEGSWNSHVDFKIFLHTNSKAFTAKTSCVRRRYSEFVWLKKKLQKNAGLVPVPELPGKSLFSFSNEDFLERRRKGLQAFLDKVVNMTVCLSDSQLHLFLQTQLPVGHILDCVQGHTPYTVMDAILTYASSNRGFAQAQEDDSIKEPSLTVSYESMESPAPHQPTEDTVRPELLPCADPDPLEGLLEIHDRDTAEKPSIRVLQNQNHLEAVVEDCGPTEASFFLGDRSPDSLSLSEETQPRSCLIQTPVEVHSPMGDGFEENCGFEEERTVTEEPSETIEEPSETIEETSETVEVTSETIEETSETVEVTSETIEETSETIEETSQTIEETSQTIEETSQTIEVTSETIEETSETIEETVSLTDLKEMEHLDKIGCELAEKCANYVLDFTDSNEQSIEDDAEEDAEEDVSSEYQVLENHITSEVSESHVTDVTRPEENGTPDEQREPEEETSDELLKEEESTPQPEVPEVGQHVVRVPEEDQDQAEQQEVDLNKEESDEDSQSLPSSNESIVKVSDEEEEEVCDEAADGYVKSSPDDVSHWLDVDACSRNILDLQMNGCSAEKDLPYMSDLRDLSDSLDVSSTVSGGDLNENSEFSILETSRVPELADGRSSPCLDASEETPEVEVH